MVQPIDLEHQGLSGAISAYFLEAPEPGLVDPGPATCLETLTRSLTDRGLSITDLRYIFLTHVHLDHAGATGHLVALNPALQVHLHRDAAPHMADPTQLVASTRRTFGDQHDRLWGQVLPVPVSNIRPWDPGSSAPVARVRAISTPGHIAHHVAYLHERSGVLLAGDSMGVILDSAAPTHPPTPPPGVDVNAWQDTVAQLEAYDPDSFGAAHFGLHADFQARRKELSTALAALERRVRAAPPAEDEENAVVYEKEVRAQQAPAAGRERVDRYFDAFAAANDWVGMRLYVRRHPA